MLYVTVALFGRRGEPGEFRDYETKALALFRKHGGEVVVAYAPDRDQGKAEVPDEIQVLRIGSRAAFDGFMQDPERLRLAGERDAVIRKTEVYLSENIIGY
jgi:hypothetical protein